MYHLSIHPSLYLQTTDYFKAKKRPLNFCWFWLWIDPADEAHPFSGWVFRVYRAFALWIYVQVLRASVSRRTSSSDRTTSKEHSVHNCCCLSFTCIFVQDFFTSVLGRYWHDSHHQGQHHRSLRQHPRHHGVIITNIIVKSVGHNIGSLTWP